MSTGETLTLLVGGVLAVGVIWVFLTRRSSETRKPPKPMVAWLRPIGSRIAHAFRVAELVDELGDVEALAFCGRWRVAELIEAPEPIEPDDDDVPRYAACARVVKRMEQRPQ